LKAPRTLLSGGVPGKPWIFANNDLMDEQVQSPQPVPAPALRAPRTLFKSGLPLRGLWIFANNDLMDEQPPAPVYQPTPALHPYIFAKSPPGVIINNYILVASMGSFAVTAQTASMVAARVLTASSGGFAVTARTAGLVAARLLSASYGSFAVTAQTTGLVAARVVSANYGAFAVTAQTASLTSARVLSGSYGVFTQSAQTAGLVYAAGTVVAGPPALHPWIFVPHLGAIPAAAANVLNAQTGVFGMTGGTAMLAVTAFAAPLLALAKIPLGGFWIFSHVPLAFAPGAQANVMLASYGSFAVSAQTAGLVSAHVLSGSYGTFGVSAQTATLLAGSGAVGAGSWHRRRREMLASRGRGV
jgi:hypothetical protein